MQKREPASNARRVPIALERVCAAAERGVSGRAPDNAASRDALLLEQLRAAS